jgi:hypothetical protein
VRLCGVPPVEVPLADLRVRWLGSAGGEEPEHPPEPMPVPLPQRPLAPTSPGKHRDVGPVHGGTADASSIGVGSALDGGHEVVVGPRARRGLMMLNGCVVGLATSLPSCPSPSPDKAGGASLYFTGRGQGGGGDCTTGDEPLVCHGIGLVRAVDVERGLLYILCPPLALADGSGFVSGSGSGAPGAGAAELAQAATLQSLRVDTLLVGRAAAAALPASLLLTGALHAAAPYLTLFALGGASGGAVGARSGRARANLPRRRLQPADLALRQQHKKQQQ